MSKIDKIASLSIKNVYFFQLDDTKTQANRTLFCNKIVNLDSNNESTIFSFTSHEALLIPT